MKQESNQRYFMHLRNHPILPSCPPVLESEIENEINLRGWNREEVVLEPGDLNFLEVLRPYYESLRS